MSEYKRQDFMEEGIKSEKVLVLCLYDGGRVTVENQAEVETKRQKQFYDYANSVREKRWTVIVIH